MCSQNIPLIGYCIFVSETYEVLDCFCYDGGTEVNHNDAMWEYNSNRISVVRGADGSIATKNDTTSYDYLTTNKNNTSSSQYDWTATLCIEFDYEKLTTTGGTQLQIIDTNNVAWTSWLNTDGHLKLIISEDKVRYFINDVEQSPSSKTMGSFLVRFYMQSGASFKFKDFKIYPI